MLHGFARLPSFPPHGSVHQTRLHKSVARRTCLIISVFHYQHLGNSGLLPGLGEGGNGALVVATTRELVEGEMTEESLLIMDSLDAQRREDYIQSLAEALRLVRSVL